jgi:hypothetical protein
MRINGDIAMILLEKVGWVKTMEHEVMMFDRSSVIKCIAMDWKWVRGQVRGQV